MPRWGNTMPATVVASRLEVISKTKAYADSLCADLHCSLAVPFKRSLSLPHLSLSLSLSLSFSPVVTDSLSDALPPFHRAANQI